MTETRADRIARLVAEAPPLSARQRDTIVGLLAPTSGATARAA